MDEDKNNKFLLNLVKFYGLFTISASIFWSAYPKPETQHPGSAFLVLAIIIPVIVAPLTSLMAALFYYLKINRYAFTSLIEPLFLGPLMTLVFMIGDSSNHDALMPDSEIFATIYSYFDFGWPFFNIIVAILLVQGGIIHLYHFIRNKRAEKNDQAANPNI